MVGVFLVYVIFKNTINYLKFYSLKIFLHSKLYTFGCKKMLRMNSITSQIENIMSENQGKIFSINDFYELGTKNTIKSVLYRLNKEGKVVRLLDGLYTKPKYSKTLKEYSYPSTNAVAKKIADKFSWTIVPAEDMALNYVGVSTQVPNEYI